MTCEHCGARLDPNAMACPFCKAPTPLAAHARARQEEEARTRAEWHTWNESQRFSVLRKQMETTATHALAWSLAGTFFFCLPISVVGVVQGVRARKLAQQLRLPLPGRALSGIVVGIIGALLPIAFLTFGAVLSERDDAANTQRIAELEKDLGERAKAPTLDHDVACTIAELHARRNGFDKERGSSLENFQCVGLLTSDHERAALEAFRFTRATNKFDVNVCLERGAQWYVKDMRRAPCD